MNTKTLKGAALLLVGMASAGSAAQIITRQGTLGAGATVTDSFRLDCNLSDIAGAQARVSDINPPSNRPAKMRVVLINCGVTCTEVRLDTNPNPHGELGGPSGWSIRNNGNGIYNVYILKSANGGETYNVEATCRQVSNSSIRLVQPRAFVACQNERPSMTPCP
ncbi:MAG: hypothetical protein ACREXR_01040 [Gammaproteobacteria bacterium]